MLFLVFVATFSFFFRSSLACLAFTSFIKTPSAIIALLGRPDISCTVGQMSVFAFFIVDHHSFENLEEICFEYLIVADPVNKTCFELCQPVAFHFTAEAAAVPVVVVVVVLAVVVTVVTVATYSNPCRPHGKSVYAVN